MIGHAFDRAEIVQLRRPPLRARGRVGQDSPLGKNVELAEYRAHGAGSQNSA